MKGNYELIHARWGCTERREVSQISEKVEKWELRNQTKCKNYHTITPYISSLNDPLISEIKEIESEFVWKLKLSSIFISTLLCGASKDFIKAFFLFVRDWDGKGYNCKKGRPNRLSKFDRTSKNGSLTEMGFIRLQNTAKLFLLMQGQLPEYL